MIQAPSFYYQKKGMASFLLFPFSLIFLAFAKIRNFFIKPFTLQGKFVICIGNATLGGAGKTPAAIFIGALLKEQQLNFCFLSKGYGRKSSGFFEVKPESDPFHAGDEPTLLAKHGRTFVFSKYEEIKKNIQYIKENIIIMDDGMQNSSIYKNLTFLITDMSLKFGNGFIFPAGPLRESKEKAISKADAIIALYEKSDHKSRFFTDKPVFSLEKHYFLLEENNTDCSTDSSIDYKIKEQHLKENLPRKEGYLAFSGLASNEKFFNSLEASEINVKTKIRFKDHHAYTLNDIKYIKEQAGKTDLKIITTQKDYTKIKKYDLSCFVWYLQLKNREEEKLKAFFLEKLHDYI